MQPTDPAILLTIDVEDWFQVENFKDCIPFSSWDSCELRVERNVHRLLDLFDETSHRPSAISYKAGCERSAKGTFFILGWVAERLPKLVREIHNRDHEIASHGYNHCLCNDCSAEKLMQDLVDSKKKLEDIIGGPVYGYRAPSFSISDDVLKMIRDCGYLYDSSYNSFGLHSRYGKVDFSRNGKRGLAYQVSEGFFELPISNIEFKFQHSIFKNTKFTLPWGGGGYFRLIPFFLFRHGINSILKKDGAYLFYLHPWEIDVEQPKVKNAGKAKLLRHYVNLDKTYSRLSGIFESFKECDYVSCHQYLHMKSFSE